MNPREKIYPNIEKTFNSDYWRKIRSFELTIATAPIIPSKTTAPATKLKIKLDNDGVILTTIYYFNRTDLTCK